MIAPTVKRQPDGGLIVSDLAPWFVTALLELPDLLAPEQPDAVRDRLYPEPAEDAELCEDWERLVRPELFALIASAREILLRDMGRLGPQEGPGGPVLWSVAIAPSHIAAWISALNAGRLTLGARHGIEEEDMERERAPEEWGEKDVAVAKIYIYGMLQQFLIEAGEEPDQAG